MTGSLRLNAKKNAMNDEKTLKTSFSFSFFLLCASGRAFSLHPASRTSLTRFQLWNELRNQQVQLVPYMEKSLF